MYLYRYFISFRTESGRYGNTILILDTKLNDEDHINQVQAHLLELVGEPSIVLVPTLLSSTRVKKQEDES
jgi:RNA binding exosome subunit